MELAFLHCRVTIFVCGREYIGSEDACRITSLKQPVVSAGHYEKGVSFHYRCPMSLSAETYILICLLKQSQA